MSARLLVALLALPLGACGDQVVHVRLGSGTWPGCPDAEFLLSPVWIVKAQLHVGSRPTSPMWPACVETTGQIWTLAALERKFRDESKVFDHVPSEGPWRLVIAGYPKEPKEESHPSDEDTCDRPRTQAALLCGMTTGEMFPPSSELTVSIDCMPRFTTDPEIKERIKSCAANIF
jgi:hypothetical protein